MEAKSTKVQLCILTAVALSRFVQNKFMRIQGN